MALDLGPSAFEAAQRLKNSSDWQTVVTALTETMGKVMHHAVELATPEAAGYARGLRDVVWALEVMEAGSNAPARMSVKPTVTAASGRR